jgi:hypothetical protein
MLLHATLHTVAGNGVSRITEEGGPKNQEQSKQSKLYKIGMAFAYYGLRAGRSPLYELKRYRVTE